MGAAQRGGRLGRQGGGGEIHGPEHHSGGGEVDTAGVDDAENLRAVPGQVAPVHGHAKPSEAGETTSAGHGVESGAGVEVMAAAGASADGGAVAVAAAGEGVAADTDDQGRVHRDLRRVIGSG